MSESKLRGIGMLISDVDGVMTDGGLYYDDQGRISKRFHVQDGLGVKLAQAAGLEIGVFTGLSSEAVRLRIEELGIRHYYAGRWNKGELLTRIASEQGLSPQEVAYLGDDWVDVPAMAAAGLPIAVANAQPEVKRIAEMVTTVPGGQGALREAIVWILRARGNLDRMWQQWTQLDAEGFI